MTPEAWRALTQAERDAAYDNTAAFPDSAALTAARQAMSAALRQSGGWVELPYGAGPRNVWDVHASAAKAAPWLVFIHGGYWQKNRREDFTAVAQGVLDHGWSAALPGYTLAPEASLSEIVAEIGEALDRLAEYRAGHGFDGPLVLAGWSAGAHLAALHMHHPSVSAGLLISGLFDLAPLADTALNAALALNADEITRLSPLGAPIPDRPIAMALGERELPALARQNNCYFERLRQAGARPLGLVVPGADHFSILQGLEDGASPLTGLALTLVLPMKTTTLCHCDDPDRPAANFGGNATLNTSADKPASLSLPVVPSAPERAES